MNKLPDLAELGQPALQIVHSWSTHIGERRGRTPWRSTSDPETIRMLKQVEEAAKTYSCEHKCSAESYKDRAAHFDGGITTNFTEIVTVTSAAVAAFAALLRQITPVLVALIQKKGARSIRVRIGEVEIELKGTADAKKALALVEQAAQSAKKHDDA